MKLGTRVVIVVRMIRDRVFMGYRVCRAQVMETGRQNVGRIRVRIDDALYKGTGWIYPNEEGEEWARGWNGVAARALAVAKALS